MNTQHPLSQSHFTLLTLFALGMIAIALMLWIPSPVAAQGGLIVNNSGDVADPDVGTEKDDHACDTAFTDSNGNIVNNGVCTLRAAIQNANFVGGGSITFNGGMTIQPASVLPRLRAPISIDGGGQVTLDGSAGVGGGDTIFDPVGLAVYHANCTIRGMKIVGFGTGIRLATSAVNNVFGDNALIENNAIGETGNGNGYGLFIDSNSNIVQNNSISGNRTGAYITFGSSGSLIANNTITYNGVTGAIFGGNQFILTAQDGLVIVDTTNNTVRNNVISGNGRHGILLRSANSPTTGNIVRGNMIGVDAGGVLAVPNGSDGILLGGDDNQIGGPAASDGNIISGNGGQGIRVSNSNNLIRNNLVGVNAAGTAPIPNADDGISFNGGGGNNSILDNLISGNGGDGLELGGGGQNANIAKNNKIGVDAAGATAIPNAQNGIHVTGPNSVIGGAAGEGNLVSGNGGHGILAAGADAAIVGNRIGVNADASAPLGNGGDGIRIPDSSRNIITDNIIGGNAGYGLYAEGGNAAGNIFKHNFVGTNADRSASLGNGLDGVRSLTSGIVIGGPAGEGNVIAHNVGAGIVALTNLRLTLRTNALYNNGGLGIDLGNDGVTENDLNDADINFPNSAQNFPVLVSASSGQPIIEGTFFGAANRTLQIDFFVSSQCDASGFGEGEIYLGSQTVNSDSRGYGNFIFNATTAVPDGWFATATATDNDGNTSEFSRCLVIPTTGNVVRWNNPNGGNWNNPNNWSPAVVPQSPHNAVITLPGDYSVTLDVDADIRSLTLGGENGVQTLVMAYNGFGGYGLTLSAPSVINANGVLSLQDGGFFDNGGLINNSTLTVDGRFEWTNGRARGSGELVIGVNGRADISGGVLDGLTLSNAGVVSLGANVFNTSLFIENDPTINNGGLWELSGSIRTNPPGGVTASQFNNSGTLRLAGFNLNLELAPQVSNSGLFEVGNNSSLVLPGGYVQSAGELSLDNGSLYRNNYGTDDMTINGGSVTGSGNIFANLVNNGGAVSPGQSPGRLVLRGYVQGAGATLNIELAGLDENQFTPEFDLLDISFGAVSLDGTLNISVINGFSTVEGDAFRILMADNISGQFATVNGPDLGDGATYTVNYYPTRVTLSHGPEAPPQMDLSIELYPSTYEVDPNTQLNYYLSVSNYQPGGGGGGGGESASGKASSTANLAAGEAFDDINSSQNVIVTVELPAGVAFQSASASQGECTGPATGAGGVVTCALGEVFQSYEGPSVYLSIDALVTATSGELVTTASVSSDTPDSDLDNNTAIAIVTVNGVSNNPPVADDQAIAADEDTPVNVTLTASDADGNPLSFSVMAQPQNGVLGGVAPDLTYTPGADFSGSDSFTFVANDGATNSNEATVSITVNPVNDNPQAVDDSAAGDEDSPIRIDVLANDSDAEGDAVSLSGVSSPSHGAAAIDNGQILYTPNANYAGGDSFSYTITDGNGGSASATVDVTINPVNDNPQAVDDSATTDQNTAATVQVLSNDSDVDGDALTVSAVGGASNGGVTHDGTSVTYTPNAGFSGGDSFSYTISDGNGGSASATVNVTVNGSSAQPMITIALDSRPERAANVRFDGSAPIGRFFLDDVTPQDNDAHSNSKSFVVEPGSYTITETTPHNWFVTAIVCTPSANAAVDLFNNQVTITVVNGDNVICTFVTQKEGKVRATLFHDVNGNGVRQGGEPWNEGWTVNLFDEQNVLVASDVTNGHGKVSFTDVRPGSYTLCEVLQDGLTHPQPCQPIIVEPAETLQVVFANRTAAVSTAAVENDGLATKISRIADSASEINDESETPTSDAVWLNSVEPTVGAGSSHQRIFLPLINR